MTGEPGEQVIFCDRNFSNDGDLAAARCCSVSTFSPSFIGQMNLIVFEGEFILVPKGQKGAAVALGASHFKLCCISYKMCHSRLL